MMRMILTATAATPMATALQATPKVARMTKQVICRGMEKEGLELEWCCKL